MTCSAQQPSCIEQPSPFLSSSSMFRLTNSVHPLILDYFVFHLHTSSLLVDTPFSIKRHYSGTIYSTLSDTLLP